MKIKLQLFILGASLTNERIEENIHH